MMAAEKNMTSDWLDSLPLRGRVTRNASLAKITWFRVGGPAEVLFQPEDEEDLQTLLWNKPEDVPVTVLGLGSNLLVRDGGVPGVVIRLGKAFAKITVKGDRLTAGAAAPDLYVARAARDAGLAGMEFLCGVPGTIGGAIRMNAGAYGREIKDILRRAEMVSTTGVGHSVDLDGMEFGYRHCGIDEGWIFTQAMFLGTPGDKAEITARMEEIGEDRMDSQPVRSRTGGSTFANPEGAKAWELIDAAGGRGLALGGAMVSEQHCNFLINTGDATAADIEALGEELRRRVRENSGIELRWEIRRIGRPAGEAV